MSASQQATREAAAVSEGKSIEYWLVRKKVKNINIHIKPPDGRVNVSAPLHAPKETIDALVRNHAEWIAHAQAVIAASPCRQAELATDEEKAQWRSVVEACTKVYIAKWERIIGVRAGEVVFRDMKSRWGSCKVSTGRICINIRLALYPPECLEYIVVHELCHLRESGHGPAFHALLDRFLPDWKARQKMLH